MRGEAAPYSLVPSAESSLLQEKEGQGLQVIKEAANIITDKSRDKKRRWEDHSWYEKILLICLLFLRNYLSVQVGLMEILQNVIFLDLNSKPTKVERLKFTIFYLIIFPDKTIPLLPTDHIYSIYKYTIFTLEKVSSFVFCSGPPVSIWDLVKKLNIKFVLCSLEPSPLISISKWLDTELYIIHNNS